MFAPFLPIQYKNRHLYHILNAESLTGTLEYSDNQTAYMNEIGIQKRIAVLSQFEITEVAEYIRNMDKADRILY